MLRGLSKTSLLIVLVSLCVSVPIANTEGASSNWTSPTMTTLCSVSTIDANEGWIVGYFGTAFRWVGTEWIPEFPTLILTLLCVNLTLVAVILAKAASKKRRRASLSSKTRP